jgi:hypothetical protein
MYYPQCVYCHGHHLNNEPAGHDPNFPALLSHQCYTCSKKWFSCDGSCNVHNKSSFYAGMGQAQRHFLLCCHGTGTGTPHSNHPNPAASALDQSLLDTCLMLHHNPPDVAVTVDTELDLMDDDVSSSSPVIAINPSVDIEEEVLINSRDGDELAESGLLDLHYQVAPVLVETETTTQAFKRHMITGHPLDAASLLVSRAAFGTDSLSTSSLPTPNILFFFTWPNLL